MSENTEAILQKLDLIFDALSVQRDVFHMSYPANGGNKTLPVGTTSVDFYGGYITYPDGTRDKLPSSLRGMEDDYIRSCSLNVSREVTVNLDTMTGIMSSGRGLQCNVCNHEFRVLHITTTVETDVSLWASSKNNNLFTKDAFTSIVSTEVKPTGVISDKKTDIKVVASKLTTVDTPITKSVTVKCRSLGAGTYIAIGNTTTREFRFLAVGDWHEIDYIDNLNKIYVSTDAGATGELEWIGG